MSVWRPWHEKAYSNKHKKLSSLRPHRLLQVQESVRRNFFHFFQLSALIDNQKSNQDFEKKSFAFEAPTKKNEAQFPLRQFHTKVFFSSSFLSSTSTLAKGSFARKKKNFWRRSRIKFFPRATFLKRYSSSQLLLKKEKFRLRLPPSRFFSLCVQTNCSLEAKRLRSPAGWGRFQDLQTDRGRPLFRNNSQAQFFTASPVPNIIRWPHWGHHANREIFFQGSSPQREQEKTKSHLNTHSKAATDDSMEKVQRVIKWCQHHE